MPNEKPIDTPTTAQTEQPDIGADNGLTGNVSGAPALTIRSRQDETVADRLKRVYPEHYVRIITNSNQELGSTHTARLLGESANKYNHHCLAVMFTWNDSPEGSTFWVLLSNREYPHD